MSLKFGDAFNVLDDNLNIIYEKLGCGNKPEFLFLFNDNGKLHYKIIDDRDNSVSPYNTDDSLYAKLLKAKALIILADLLNSGTIEPVEEE